MYSIFGPEAGADICKVTEGHILYHLLGEPGTGFLWGLLIDSRRSRREVLTMEIIPNLNIGSSICEHRHSRVVVDNSLHINNKQDNTTYDGKQ